MLDRLRKLQQRLSKGEAVPREELLAVLEWAAKRLADDSPGPHLLYADGGSRGNPGPAAYGLVLLAPDGAELARRAERIGHATNNVAEYRGLLAGLQTARELGVTDLEARLDSELVVRQLNGEYRAKNPAMRELRDQALELARSFRRVAYRHIPRERNRLADSLVNAALDGQDPESLF